MLSGYMEAGEGHQEGIPLGVDLLSIHFFERGTEETPLFFEDLRIPAIAKALRGAW